MDVLGGPWATTTAGHLPTLQTVSVLADYRILLRLNTTYLSRFVRQARRVGDNFFSVDAVRIHHRQRARETGSSLAVPLAAQPRPLSPSTFRSGGGRACRHTPSRAFRCLPPARCRAHYRLPRLPAPACHTGGALMPPSRTTTLPIACRTHTHAGSTCHPSRHCGDFLHTFRRHHCRFLPAHLPAPRCPHCCRRAHTVWLVGRTTLPA